MQLKSLIDPERVALPSGGNIEISGLTSDSRKAGPGMLFAALPGSRADGAAFVADAVTRGAAAVLVGESVRVAVPAGVALLRARDPREALAHIAARFYGAQPATVVAVTGTNGKTSVAEFSRQLFAALGHASASLGTIGIVRPDGSVYGSLTTPDPIALHATLADLARDGITHLAIEASSHGLDQHRLDGVRLAAGAFTNLGRDHLDYHPTMAAYLAAKMRLFSELLQPGQPAVIDADGDHAADVIAAANARGLRVLTTGRTGGTQRLSRIQPDGFSQRLEIVHEDHTYRIRFALPGIYQASNALMAAGL
ncbi:MAG: Mur ligase family protein, partial [Hyphomicrobiaceae bacterium]